MIINTFGPHKASRIATWHSPNGEHYNQIDYIMVKKRFRSSVNIAKTRNFPGADIGSDHELVMMTFKLHLKRVKQQEQTRVKFYLDKLKDPKVAEEFRAMIGGKFAALTILDVHDTDMDMFINKFNKAVTDTAKETLGSYRPIKKPWVTADILDLYDKGRELKKKKKDPDGAKEYRKANKNVRKSMKQAKETWVDEKCQRIEENLVRNNSGKAYQLVRDLVNTEKGQTGTTIIQDKEAKCLTEEGDVMGRWTEYCAELYNHSSTGDLSVLDVPTASNNENHRILRSEVESAVRSLKKGKTAGVDGIPAELVLAGGEDMITTLLQICNKI